MSVEVEFGPVWVRANYARAQGWTPEPSGII